MSYLIKERMMSDKSSTDSAVAIKENFAGKKKLRMKESAAFEAKKDDAEVAGYHHFPADNITQVWLNIFEKLDTEDKITFLKSCGEWHNWVAAKRTSYLFREVVPMLAQNLPKKEILRCRTICKSWTHDFNCVYPAHPAHLRLESEINEDLEVEICNIDNHFRSLEKIQSFLNEMHSHHGNPFPGRSIRLAIEIEVSYQTIVGPKANRLRLLRDYFAKAIELLQVLGCHVHMAHFDLRHCDQNCELEVLEIYKYFRSCLVCMPNLKKLVVEGRNDSMDYDEHLAFYREYPLPQLPYLEMVSLDETSPAIWNGVLESSCAPLNVKRLFLQPASNEMENLRLPEATTFPNLEAFEVRLLIEYLERFVNVLERAHIPPVFTLDLHQWMLNEEDFGRVFGNLEVFAWSLACLKLLHLNFSEGSLRHAIATRFAVNLPKLERLELLDYDGPLDPFCQLPSLKFLTIVRLEVRVRQWDGSMVDFDGLEERMEESNIWEKIPSLQEFHIESSGPPVICKTYHRDMFQLSPSG